MSDELADEVEAVNSIYGADTLARADDDDDDDNGRGGGGGGDDKTEDPGSVYVLRLPGEASWLRLRFPATYPARPAAAVGTQRSSGGVRGAGARDLALFRAALGDVFEPGAVCIFDAVEEFSARLAAEGDAPAERPAERQQQPRPGPLPSPPPPAADDDDVGLAAPQWTVSEPVTEHKSTVVAHAARVTTPAQARAHVAHLLASDRRLRTATHNMSAWRVRGPDGHHDGGGMHDCDDDGESAAGGRLLHLMHLMGLWDAVVVVSRWYGGVKLGPRRFAVINAVARDALVRAGLVDAHHGDRARGKRTAR